MEWVFGRKLSFNTKKERRKAPPSPTGKTKDLTYGSKKYVKKPNSSNWINLILLRNMDKEHTIQLELTTNWTWRSYASLQENAIMKTRDGTVHFTKWFTVRFLCNGGGFHTRELNLVISELEADTSGIQYWVGFWKVFLTFQKPVQLYKVRCLLTFTLWVCWANWRERSTHQTLSLVSLDHDEDTALEVPLGSVCG